MANRLQQVVSGLQQEHGLTVTVGLCARAAIVAGCDISPYPAFISCAQYAVVALRRQLHTAKGQVGIYKTICRDDSGLIPEKLVDRLRLAVHTGHAVQAASLYTELRDNIFGITYIPLLRIHVILQTLVLNMAQAAQSAGVDTTKLCRLNNHYLNRLMTTYDYDLLQQSGYGSLQHFNRVFQLHEGCTPTQFRRSKSVQ